MQSHRNQHEMLQGIDVDQGMPLHLLVTKTGITLTCIVILCFLHISFPMNIKLIVQQINHRMGARVSRRVDRFIKDHARYVLQRASHGLAEYVIAPS